MKGAMFYGAHDLRVQDVPEPTLRAHEVAIRTAYTGICGSDLHILHRGAAFSAFKPPCIIGHELSGVVSAVGAEVTTCAPGDRVTTVPWAQCSKCAYCRRGLVNHCPHKRAVTGAFAEIVVAPESAVYRLAADLPLRRAALAEPLSCCVWALDQAGLRTGETVLIVGGGPIGLMLLLLAQWSGAAQTIVAELSPVRRQLAADLGATAAVDPRDVDLTALVHDHTDGLGADVAFEAVGHPSALRSTLDCVRHAGTVVVVGVADPAATLPLAPYDIYHRELTLRGSFTRRLTYDRALPWLRRAEFDRLISHELPLRDILVGFDLATRAQCGKVLILPNDGPPAP